MCPEMEEDFNGEEDFWQFWVSPRDPVVSYPGK